MVRRARGAVRRIVVAGVLGAVAVVATPGPAVLAQAPPPRVGSGDAEVFLDAAASDLLGRPATADERQGWLDDLAAGASRTSVAREMTHAPDHASRVVTTLYRRALGRQPDGPGLAFWTGRLVAGRATATLASQLYGSDEAYGNAGSTPGGYVDATYAALLGRPADASGRAYWVGRIQARESRQGLARSLYLSAESNGLRTVLAYLDLLRRPALVGERPYWSQRLTRTDDLDFEAIVAGSEEYLARWRSFEVGPRPVSLTLGISSGSTPTVSGDGRYVAFVSADGRLVPGGPRPRADVFLLDRQVGRYRALTRGNAASGPPDLSADGSTVVFSSRATNLVSGDSGGHGDIFAASTRGGPVRRIVAGDGESTDPSVSADGSVVAFTSDATDLAPGGDGTRRVHIARRGPGGEVTSIERVGGDAPSDRAHLAAGGSAVVFTSEATDLDPATEPGTTNAFWAPLPLGGGAVALTTAGTAGEAGGGVPGVSADGAVVGFTVALEVSSGPVPSAARAARIEGGAVVDVRPLPPAYLATRVVVADDGGSALVSTVLVPEDRPYRVGELHRPIDADPVTVGTDGDLSADGRVAVFESQLSPAFTGEIRLLGA